MKNEAISLINFYFDRSDTIEVLSEKEELESYLLDVNEHLEDVPEEDDDKYFNGYRIIMDFKEFRETHDKPQYITSNEF